MRFIIGGRAQGKEEYLLSQGQYQPAQIAKGGSCPLEQLGDKPVLSELHLLVRRWTQSGRSLAQLKEKLLASSIEVLICDEIGSGIVPLDPAEEQWREDVGRLCCVLAAQAEQVERVYCGLAQRLKG